MAMKMMNSAVLVGLPREVLHLIRDGVYSLYSLPPDASARYVLVTNRGEFYFLSADGHPQPRGSSSLDDVELEQVVGFSDPAEPHGMQMNWAV